MEIVHSRQGHPLTGGILPPRHLHEQPAAGTADGINIAPGSEDDGWIVPPPVTLADGSRIQLYKDGEALHAAYEAIAQACRRVCLEIYIWRDDETGWAFAELLARKSRQGVRVHILFDSIGCFETSRRLFEHMRAAGCRVEEFHPVRPWETRFSWRPADRDHRKLLFIDEEIAGMGGLNIGNEYAGPWVAPRATTGEVWRDNAIGVAGPAARLFLESFVRTWGYVTRGGRVRQAELVHDLQGEFGFLASVPSLASPLGGILLQLFREARHSIEMTMAYFAPFDEQITALCRAPRRGVRVRLMMPGRTDVKIMRIAARSFYDTLLAAGVEIYERQAAVLHAKGIVIDGHTSVVGSTNLDHRSIQKNLELSAFIRSPFFARQMHDLFEHDVRYARRILPDEWRRRPHLDRITQWAVKRARYLL